MVLQSYIDKLKFIAVRHNTILGLEVTEEDDEGEEEDRLEVEELLG